MLRTPKPQNLQEIAERKLESQVEQSKARNLIIDKYIKRRKQQIEQMTQNIELKQERVKQFQRSQAVDSVERLMDIEKKYMDKDNHVKSIRQQLRESASQKKLQALRKHQRQQKHYERSVIKTMDKKKEAILEKHTKLSQLNFDLK